MTHMRAGTASAFITFADVEAFTAKLKVISDWRDELQSKLDRATLRFELCGLVRSRSSALRRCQPS
jgi:hypothetical protein